MPKYDRKNISEISTLIREKMGSDSITTGGTEKLCPHCFSVVTGHPRVCACCKKAFKSSKKAGLLSLLFPGLGDLYLGHKGFAILEILGAAFVWISFFIPDPESKEPVTIVSIISIAIVGFILKHGTNSFVTTKLANKGVYPEKSNV
jgi:hypothetical protein